MLCDYPCKLLSSHTQNKKKTITFLLVHVYGFFFFLLLLLLKMIIQWQTTYRLCRCAYLCIYFKIPPTMLKPNYTCAWNSWNEQCSEYEQPVIKSHLTQANASAFLTYIFGDAWILCTLPYKCVCVAGWAYLRLCSRAFWCLSASCDYKHGK